MSGESVVYRYAEHAPSAALADHVACFWTSVPAGPAAIQEPTHRVLPDGCIDIIINLGEPWTEVDASREIVEERSFVVGAMTRAVLVERGSGAHFLGVRFRPGRAASVLRVAACELTDQRIPLSAFWRDADALVERLGEERTLGGQVAALDSALTHCLGRLDKPSREVDVAVGRIVATHGRIWIESLSDVVGLSRQHLARMFAQHVGLSPKTFARVMRVQAAVRRLRRRPPLSSSMLALDLGFYDQAHLVSEVRALTGLTPGTWASRP